jgi:hypothetical protein
MDAKEGSMTSEFAARVASAIAAAPGVEGAVLGNDEGTVLGAAPTSTASRDAGLAAFVAQRAEALSGDGDLRGMGRLVSGSCFQQLSASWPGGEALVLTFANARLFVSLRRGVSAETAAPVLRTVLRRYS